MQGCRGDSSHSNRGGKEHTEKSSPAPQVNATLYYMSKCPYGQEALSALRDAKAHLDGTIKLNLNLDYVGLEKQDGTMVSLNGAGEVSGNQAQLCAREQGANYLDKFLACQQQNLREIPGNTDSCVTQSNLNRQIFTQCLNSEKSLELLRDSYRRTSDRGITAGPTITIGNKIYSGKYDPQELIDVICQGPAWETLPAACKNSFEKSPNSSDATRVILITDKRCRTCNPQAIIKSAGLDQFNLKQEVLDYNQSPLARELLVKTGHKLLPVVLFDQAVENNAPLFQKIGRQLEPRADYRSLRISARFNPTAEICDNDQDDTGNGLVDCKDPSCTDTLPCRPEALGRLDLFLTGNQAGQGNQLAIEALQHLIERFGDKLHYSVRLLAPYKASELVDVGKKKDIEDLLVNTCATLSQRMGTSELVSFLQCYNSGGNRPDTWEKCAELAGLDAGVISRCVAGGDGIKMLTAQNVLAEKLGLENTPAWLINNRHISGALTPNGIQTEICQHNKNLAGCETPLEAESGHVHGPNCNH